jgi:hypothetical protein
VEKFVVLSVEERLAAWREAEKAACEAEAAIARLGQAAADPSTRDLFIKAAKLRVHADQQLAAALRHVKMGDPA